MKIIKSGIFRALCAVVVGVLLVMYDEQMVEWMAKIIGGLFFVSGLISVIGFLVDRSQLPFVGVGSMILGIVLAVMPTTFITWIMYVLAALLILGAVGQYANLWQARKYSTFSFFYWVPPTITLAVGILILANPMETAALPFKIIGYAMMFYGVIETINSIQISRAKKAFMKAEETREAEEAEVEEIKEEPVQEEQAQEVSQEEEQKNDNQSSTDNPLYILTDNTDTL